ncbi:MAG TPA: hypothetical protein VG346_09100 [Acidimicrobiales bacterium]|nr:hypothetical protein [Acidimicrobiales bacterium]
MGPGRRSRRRRVTLVVLAAVVVTVLGLGAVVIVLTSHRKVLLVGDSIMQSAGPAATGDLQRQGFQVQVVAYFGTGLLDTKFDWLARMRQLVAQDHPDIVVVEFVGNYGLFGTRPGIADMTPQFFAAWAAAAQQATDILSSDHAQVYWVLGPPMARQAMEQKLTTLDMIYTALRAPLSPAHRPLFVDEVKPFVDAQGRYLPSIVGPDGRQVPLRLPDGVHLAAPAGTQRFADAMTASLTANTG